MRDFIGKELAEDDLSMMVPVWEEFENCSRGSQTIDSFLSDFELFSAVMAASQSSAIPAEKRAVMVLKRLGATEEQRMLILAKLNKEDNQKFLMICVII